MYIFEAIMLLCLGVVLFFQVVQTCKIKNIDEKNVVLLFLTAIAYISGMVHKFISGLDWVIYLYTFNLFLSLFDISLYFKYKKPSMPKSLTFKNIN